MHAICEAREQAPTRCLYLAWHCDSRSCHIVLAEAAQEDLDDLVDDEARRSLSRCRAATRPPLSEVRPRPRCRKPSPLSRQEDEQQGHAVEYHLVSIVQGSPG